MTHVQLTRVYDTVLQCHSTHPENAKVRDPQTGVTQCVKDIFQAAIEGDVACIEANLELGVDINKMGQPNSIWGSRFEKSGLFYATPLHYACSYNREVAVRYLLLRGARVDIRSASGLTCKEYARRRQYTSILQLLERGGNGGGSGGGNAADGEDASQLYEETEAEAAALQGGEQ